MEGAPKAGERITFQDGSKLRSGIVQEDGSVVDDNGKVFDNIYQGYDGRFFAGEIKDNYETTEEGEIILPEVEKKVRKKSDSGDAYWDWKNWKDQQKQKAYDEAIKQAEADLAAAKRDINSLSNNHINDTKALISAQTRKDAAEAALFELQNLDPTEIEFKTGGLADFTGPAWLDGTKSKPEYVLNAAQTQGFLTLVDILDSLRGHTSFNNSQTTGGDTFDVDINIETVREEVDIDMVAEKVQKSIVSASNYRNNTRVKR